jgi:hypothetical protein
MTASSSALIVAFRITMDERVGAQVARGDCMGGHSDLPFLPCCYYAKKKVCFGLVAVVSLG